MCKIYIGFGGNHVKFHTNPIDIDSCLSASMYFYLDAYGI
jgi:hypothetical protein